MWGRAEEDAYDRVIASGRSAQTALNGMVQTCGTRSRCGATGVGMLDAELSQLATAHRFGVEPSHPASDETVGVALNLRSGQMPINGLRHAPEEKASGWFLWAGEELSDADDFFTPLHVVHLTEWCPAVVPYLALPPGWRVLLTPDYEDVWFDASLI